MDTLQIILLLFSLLLGTLSWLALREIRRVDRLEKHALEAVTHEQFESRLAEVDKQRQLWHWENSRKLDDIVNITKAIYQHATDLGRMDERVKRLEDREKYLSEWKHRVADAVIPRAIEEHERRLNIIDSLNLHARK